MGKKTPYTEYVKSRFPAKEEFKKRMEQLLGEAESKKFFEISYTLTPPTIRINTLKISIPEMIKRIKDYGWTFKQPFPKNPEIVTITSKLKPGEIGKTKEHLLGYYYVQEISSATPIIALNPRPGELFLDLCASPGSKTTQAAAMMKNEGSIIANEISIGRIRILGSNLERCGVTNAIITKKDGSALCKSIYSKTKLRFDKILVDAPCSGEGTLRKSPKTFLMWNKKMIKKISQNQKRLAISAVKLLKINGEMVYSTCTLSPEENEEVIDFMLKNSNETIRLEQINLPLKTRNGVCYWEGKKFSKEILKCVRIYPQDNNTDGFFLAKIKRIR